MSDEAGQRPGVGPRLGIRVLGVGLLALAVTGSGVALDRIEPRAQEEVGAAGRLTGAWFCPHGGGEGWRGWVVVTNPGEVPVLVRVTSLGLDRAPEVASFTVGAGRQSYHEVPADQVGASTEVEYFGGWVGVSAVLRTAGDDPSLAAERCAAAPHPAWYLPDGTTGRGETAFVVVMNPFASDAAVEVTIRTEERLLRPGSLTPYVIEPRSSVAVRLNAFALESPRERTVAVRVVTRLGRVVVGGLGLSARGVRAEAGVPSLQARWSFPASGAQTWALPVFDPGGRLASLSVLAQTGATQRVVPGLEEVDLEATSVRTFDVSEENTTGVLLQSTNRVPVAAAARVVGPGDVATLNGSARAYAQWLALPPLPPQGGTGFLVLANPRLEPATVSVRLIGREGAVEAPGLGAVTVPAGRSVVVPFPERLGGVPVSAVVEAVDGAVVVAVTGSLAGGGFAATQAQPIPV